MREIKFRIWTGEGMQTEGVICQDGNFYQSYRDYVDHLNVDLPAMQFTGLYDKNGKEIYEGDIIKWSDGYRSNERTEHVVFTDGSFVGARWGFTGTRLFPRDTGGGTTEYPYVIGNVHENPELIQE